MVNKVTCAAFLDEAQILKSLQHPNIVELRGICSQAEPVYLLMEYLPQGQLSRYLREVGHTMGLTQLIYIGAQVCTPHILQSFLTFKTWINQEGKI